MSRNPQGNRTAPARFEPTPHPDVNAALGELVPRIRRALGSDVVGVYLFGSLVAGDFDPRRSDVDLLIVLDRILSEDRFVALDRVHRQFAAGESPWALEVEAYYLTRAAMRPGSASFGDHLKVNRGVGTLEPAHRDRGWLIQAHLFREYAVPLVGPEPPTFVDPVAPGDLRRAAATSAPEWMEGLLVDPGALLQAGFQSYLVLTLCRVLYTLERDAVASKQVAGRWALTTVPDRWARIIRRALAWRKDVAAPAELEPNSDDVRETLGLIRYALDECRGA